MTTNVPLIAAAASMLLLWYALVLGFALISQGARLRPGSASMDLRSEPPAVVNLLVNRCRVTADAATATLLDLAARRILELFQPGTDPAVLLVRAPSEAPAGLRAYERRIFDLVRDVAGDRFRPVGEIVEHYAAGGPHWSSLLDDEVRDDAHQRGLTRQTDIATVWVFMALAVSVVTCCLGTNGLRLDTITSQAAIWGLLIGGYLGVCLLTVTLLMIALPHVRGDRYTAEGRRVGQQWLGVAEWLRAYETLADLPPAAVTVWDRYLAYGVALGVNPVAGEAIRLRTGRTARFVSPYGDRPRAVTTRYRRRFYVHAAGRLAFSLLILLGTTGLAVHLGPQAAGWPPPVTWTAAAAGAVAAVRAVYVVLRASLDLHAPVSVAGYVLAVHPYLPEPDGTSDWTEIVVDDGVHDTAVPWLATRIRAEGLRPGNIVRLQAQPWTRHVLRIAPVSPDHKPRQHRRAGTGVLCWWRSPARSPIR